jgi:uncharacterized protein YjdB
MLPRGFLTMPSKRKLQIFAIATTLLLLAAGVACTGFFVNPTLTSITIQPTAPAVQVGSSVTVQAFGVNNDNTSGNLTKNVSWSSSDPSIATVTGTGAATLKGISNGTATITVASQSVTATATATVFLAISSIAISPTSASTTTSGTADFTVSAVGSGGTINITSGATLTAEQGGTAVTTISCAYNGTSAQVCTANSATAGTYQIVASYPNSSLKATATLTIQ